MRYRCGQIVLLLSLVSATHVHAGESGNCEKGDMSEAMIRQPQLIGQWEQTGIEQDGEIDEVGVNLIHEFRKDCKMIAHMGSGDPSTYTYQLKARQLILTSELTGSTYYKDITQADKNKIIHGGDVFARVK